MDAAGPPVGVAGAAGAARSRAGRRALALALLCGAVGAALALVAAGQTWSGSSAQFAQGQVPVRAKGSEVTGLPSALALVGLAALVAVFAVRRAARFVVATLLTVCGGGVLASALLGADDTGALSEKAAKASGLAESGVGSVDLTAWPYVSAVGGALLVIAGLLALRYGRGWPSMSGSARYERTPLRQRAARPQRIDPDRPEDLWKALDRGEDPTHGTA
ncbi:TIGR02234 family membrane protein [Streptomyces iconiensis]|uniref:TIGR02234 family membrane protein n=1 Tax=Streptomyces iconiensis TaxID=1384038 RepID=A0ABT7A2I9_9ACTN|nr:TIGR02234 family membrane protein [Streptomyces iconiensis]MDJ1135282.1 TIGR02234 family membrane protein [Streptomyces iconiensis]